MVSSFGEIERPCKVRPGTRVKPSDFDPGWQGGGALADLSRDERKERAHEFLAQNIADLAEAQEPLWARRRNSHGWRGRRPGRWGGRRRDDKRPGRTEVPPGPNHPIGQSSSTR